MPLYKAAVLLAAAVLPALGGAPTCCAGASVLASCFGYAKGSVEDSIQRALGCGLIGGARTVVVDYVPGSGGVWSTLPLFLNASTSSDGTTLVVAAGVTLQAARGLFAGRSDCLITVAGLSGVSIVGGGPGAALRMWQADYANATLYNRSEWRHGVSLLRAANATVAGLSIGATGGDGVSINERCANVTLRALNLSGNFRNAVSVCGVRGLVIEGCLLARSAGTCCQSGIDFEPGTPAEVVQGVVVRDSVFERNAMSQLSIALHDQGGVVDDLLFDNCTFRHSVWSAISLSGFGAGGPLGRVEFRNCAVFNVSDKGILIDRRTDTGALVMLTNTTFERIGSWPITINGGGVTLANVTVTQLESRPFLYAGWNHHVLPGVNNTNGTATVLTPYPAVACIPVYNPASTSVNNHIHVACLPPPSAAQRLRGPE